VSPPLAPGVRLTVVQLVPALDAGGVERGTLEVAERLVRAGHRSIVVSAGGRLVPELVGRGSEHVRWPIGRKSLLTLRFIVRLRGLLEGAQADVVHARSRFPAWIGYLAWRSMPAGTRPRFVTTVHGLYSVGRYSAVMTRGERVIVVSETVKRYVLEHYPKVDPDRLRLIYRGVDDAHWSREQRANERRLSEWYRRYPGLEDRLVLTLPGRITRLKGHDAFLRIIARLVGAGLPVHGLVVGEEGRGAHAARLREQAAREALPVTFLGHSEDVRHVYAASDLVLNLSSRPESFGRTVLEALCLGVPVVAYDHGGVGEILAAMFPEGRVPIGDEAAAAERCRALLRHPRAVRAENAFPLERMLAQTLALYRELATARR